MAQIKENINCSAISTSECDELKKIGEREFNSKREEQFKSRFENCLPLDANFVAVKDTKVKVTGFYKISGRAESCRVRISLPLLVNQYHCDGNSTEMHNKVKAIASSQKLTTAEAMILYSQKFCKRGAPDPASQEIERKKDAAVADSFNKLKTEYFNVKSKCKSGDKESCESLELINEANLEMCKDGLEDFCKLK